jgi:hypothetical protein
MSHSHSRRQSILTLKSPTTTTTATATTRGSCNQTLERQSPRTPSTPTTSSSSSSSSSSPYHDRFSRQSSMNDEWEEQLIQRVSSSSPSRSPGAVVVRSSSSTTQVTRSILLPPSLPTLAGITSRIFHTKSKKTTSLPNKQDKDKVEPYVDDDSDVIAIVPTTKTVKNNNDDDSDVIAIVPTKKKVKKNDDSDVIAIVPTNKKCKKDKEMKKMTKEKKQPKKLRRRQLQEEQEVSCSPMEASCSSSWTLSGVPHQEISKVVKTRNDKGKVVVVVATATATATSKTKTNIRSTTKPKDTPAPQYHSPLTLSQSLCSSPLARASQEDSAKQREKNTVSILLNEEKEEEEETRRDHDKSQDDSSKQSENDYLSILPNEEKEEEETRRDHDDKGMMLPFRKKGRISSLPETSFRDQDEMLPFNKDYNEMQGVTISVPDTKVVVVAAYSKHQYNMRRREEESTVSVKEEELERELGTSRPESCPPVIDQTCALPRSMDQSQRTERTDQRQKTSSWMTEVTKTATNSSSTTNTTHEEKNDETHQLAEARFNTNKQEQVMEIGSFSSRLDELNNPPPAQTACTAPEDYSGDNDDIDDNDDGVSVLTTSGMDLSMTLSSMGLLGLETVELSPNHKMASPPPAGPNSSFDRLVAAKRLATLKLQAGLHNILLHESSLQTLTERQHARLEQDVEASRQWNASQSKEIEYLREQNIKVQQQLSDSAQKNLQLTEEHLEFRRTVFETEKELAQAQEGFLASSKETEEVSQENRRMAQNMEQLLAQMERLEKELADTRAKNDTLEELERQSASLTHVGVDHQDGKEEIESLKQEICVLHTQNKDLSVQLKQEQRLSMDASTEQESLTEQLTCAKYELEEMGTEMQQLYEDLEKLKACHSELERTKEKLEEAHRDLLYKDDTIQELTKSLTERDYAVEELKCNKLELDGIGQEMETLLEEIETLKSAMVEKEATLHATRAEAVCNEHAIHDMTLRLKERDLAVAELKNESKRKEGTIKALTRSLGDKDATMVKLKRKLGLEKEILVKEIVTLTEQCQVTKHQLETATLELDRRERTLEELAKSIEEKDLTIQALTNYGGNETELRHRILLLEADNAAMAKKLVERESVELLEKKDALVLAVDHEVAERERLEEHLESSKAELVEIGREMENLFFEIDTLKDAAEDSADQLRLKEKIIAELLRLVNEQELTIEDLKFLLDEEGSDLSKKARTLQVEILAFSEKHADMTKQSEAWESEKEALIR